MFVDDEMRRRMLAALAEGNGPSPIVNQGPPVPIDSGYGGEWSDTGYGGIDRPGDTGGGWSGRDDTIIRPIGPSWQDTGYGTIDRPVGWQGMGSAGDITRQPDWTQQRGAGSRAAARLKSPLGAAVSRAYGMPKSY